MIDVVGYVLEDAIKSIRNECNDAEITIVKTASDRNKLNIETTEERVIRQSSNEKKIELTIASF